MSFVGIGNLFNSAVGFAYIAAIARALDLNSFGKYSLIIGLLISLSRLIDFGTNSVFVAKSITSTQPQDNLRTLTNSFYILKLLLFIFSIPLSFAILCLFKVQNAPTLAIFALGLLAYGLNYTLFAVFQKNQDFLPLILLNTLPAITRGVAATLIFLKFYAPDLNQAMAIFSFSLFTSSFLFFKLPKDYKIFKLPKLSQLPAEVKELFNDAYPAGISQMIYESWASINNAVSKIITGFNEVGIFSVAGKVAQIFTVASVSIFTVLLPKNALRKKNKQGYDFTETMILSIGLLLLGVVGVVASKIAIPIIFGAKFIDSLPFINILIFASAFTAIHNFMENYFYVEKKTKTIMFINLSKLLFFFALLAITVPTYSLNGIAYSNLLAGIFGVTLTILFIRNSNRRQS